jgi:hypothetical protein
MMVFAIAALLLHLGPTADTRMVTDIAAVATSAAANRTSNPSAVPAKPAPSSPAPLDPGAVLTISLADATQSSQTFATIRLPEAAPAKPIRVVAAEITPPRKSWLLLSIAQHGAAAFDAYTTRQTISAGAHEDDPLMRPFAHSPAIYAASQVGPTLLDYAARRMQRSQHAFLRRSWWLPQSASTALLIFCGTHNLRVVTANPEGK